MKVETKVVATTIKTHMKGILHTEDYESISEIIDNIIIQNPDITGYMLYMETMLNLMSMVDETKDARDGMVSLARSMNRNNIINSVLDEVDEDDFYDDSDDFFKDI